MPRASLQPPPPPQAESTCPASEPAEAGLMSGSPVPGRARLASLPPSTPPPPPTPVSLYALSPPGQRPKLEAHSGEEWDGAGREEPKPALSPAHLPRETLAPGTGAASTSAGKALPTLPACGVVTLARRLSTVLRLGAGGSGPSGGTHRPTHLRRAL